MNSTDENQVRNIVSEMIEKNADDAQYGVVPVPAHTHNGVDSQQVALADLSDTNVPAPTEGDILQLEDGQWTNSHHLDVAHGGTGTNVLTGPIIGNVASPFTSIGYGVTGQVMLSNGGTTGPSWVTPAFFSAINGGTGTRGTGAGTGTDDVTHGLGLIPKLIYISSSCANVLGASVAVSAAHSNGFATSTSNFQCDFLNWRVDGTGNQKGGIDAAHIISLGGPLANGVVSATISVIDATKFTINWDAFGTITAAVGYSWIAVG